MKKIHFVGYIAATPPGTSSLIRIPEQYTRYVDLGSWVRVTVEGNAFFCQIRRSAHSFALPRWLFSHEFTSANRITDIDVVIEQVEPYAAKSRCVAFDWLPLVDAAHYFAQDDGEDLLLHAKYESPFRLKRVADVVDLYRLLGWYQAEGSKAGMNFTFTTSIPEALAFYAELTRRVFSFSYEETALEILRGDSESAKDARQAFRAVDAPIVAERVRSGRGGHAGVFHVRKSLPLVRLVCAALKNVFSGEWPSAEAARAFVLGWIDGDGSITRSNTSEQLRLAGGAAEHEVVKSALQHAFGWEFNASAYHQNTNDGTHITLRAYHMIDLLDANAFEFSMSRVRLLLGFGDRTEKMRAGMRAGAYARWGYVDANGVPTAQAKRVLSARKRYENLIGEARAIKKTRPDLFGRKGVACALSKRKRSEAP